MMTKKINPPEARPSGETPAPPVPTLADAVTLLNELLTYDLAHYDVCDLCGGYPACRDNCLRGRIAAFVERAEGV
jgi:hypothetical protein